MQVTQVYRTLEIDEVGAEILIKAIEKILQDMESEGFARDKVTIENWHSNRGDIQIVGEREETSEEKVKRESIVKAKKLAYDNQNLEAMKRQRDLLLKEIAVLEGE